LLDVDHLLHVGEASTAVPLRPGNGEPTSFRGGAAELRRGGASASFLVALPELGRQRLPDELAHLLPEALLLRGEREVHVPASRPRTPARLAPAPRPRARRARSGLPPRSRTCLWRRARRLPRVGGAPPTIGRRVW